MDILHIETDITSFVISGKNLKCVCRTCLQNQSNMTTLFSRNEDVRKTYAEILMAFTPVNITESDGHSKYICSTCVDFILSVYTFQQQCIQVDAILRFAGVNSNYDDEATDSKKIKEFGEILDVKRESDIENCEDETLFICEVCGDELSNTKSLEIHRKSHYDPDKYPSLCCKHYPCVCRQHKLLFEDNTDQENDTEDDKNLETAHWCEESLKIKQESKHHDTDSNESKLYNCKICARNFATRSGLNQHLVKHNNKAKFECECGKSFKRYNSLLLHKRSAHGAIRPYQCNECGKTFSQNIVLKNHMLTHNGDKPYKCKYCEKTFRQKPHVQSHELIHTGGKPYHCMICGKQFRHQNTLIHHTRIHTGENPFHCPICNRGFYHSTNMKKHILSHHKTSNQS